MKPFLKMGMLFCMLQFSTAVFSQENKEIKPVSKFETGFDGMIGISYGSKTLGINVGGPSLKYKFTKNFKVGVGAFPSLIVLDKKALPRLAVSPIIEYKRLMFITPYYGYDAKDKMIWTFGFGYKFI